MEASAGFDGERSSDELDLAEDLATAIGQHVLEHTGDRLQILVDAIDLIICMGLLLLRHTIFRRSLRL